MDGVPMRGWISGSRMFTSAVPEKSPCASPNDRPEPPAAAADREEDRVVDEREHDPGEEVQDVAERLGAGPVGREGGAEQEREDPCGSG